MNLIIQHYFMKQHFLSYLIALLLFPLYEMQAAYPPEFSTAGVYELANSGREVYSMNPAWRFHKGTATGAETTDFNDQDWKVVSLPDGIEYVPTEASGCINYQGEVWYRKHFTPANELKGKKLFLHFEAIMGKSKVFVNGNLLTEHFGGYLPVVIAVVCPYSYHIVCPPIQCIGDINDYRQVAAKVFGQ